MLWAFNLLIQGSPVHTWQYIVIPCISLLPDYKKFISEQAEKLP